MKRNIFIAVMTGMLLSVTSSCSEDERLLSQEQDLFTRNSDTEIDDSLIRLHFENEEQLEQAILSGESADDSGTRSYRPNSSTRASQSSFVSLVSPLPPGYGDGSYSTYYEALGYDSLVPNINFAKLLNLQGEMEVNDNLVKINSDGTFIVPKSYEAEFRKYLESNPSLKGQNIGENTYLINGKIKFIRTFMTKPSDYSIVSEGNYTELPENFFDGAGDDVYASNGTRAGSNEPNFDDFSIFSANHHTILGKFIENIIGSTKAHTLNYNSKRRLKGSFYFYNYGVYGEIGVKGWTDKKNWINWSKTASDELRVGWRNVMIDFPIPSEIKDAMANNPNTFFTTPRTMTVNGNTIYGSAVAMPEMPQSFWDKIIAGGTKAVISFIKSKYGDKAKDIDKCEAFVIATPSKIRVVANDGDVVKYNEKSYCHVFAKEYMNVQIGWSNIDGIFLNNVNQSNVSSIVSWIKFIVDQIKREHMTLVNGEVYVCARLGDTWRGMKIIKK